VDGWYSPFDKPRQAIGWPLGRPIAFSGPAKGKKKPPERVAKREDRSGEGTGRESPDPVVIGVIKVAAATSSGLAKCLLDGRDYPQRPAGSEINSDYAGDSQDRCQPWHGRRACTGYAGIGLGLQWTDFGALMPKAQGWRSSGVQVTGSTA